MFLPGRNNFVETKTKNLYLDWLTVQISLQTINFEVFKGQFYSDDGL